MNAINQLIAGIQQVDGMLAEEILEPDLGRDDWISTRARIKLVQDAVQADVLKPLDEALVEVGQDDLAGSMKRRVAVLLGEVAAPVYASGDASGFQLLLAKAAELSPDAKHRVVLEAGRSEPDAYCRLQHARWLQERRRHREAGKLLKRVQRDAQQPALKIAAKRAQRAPRPLQGEPALRRLYGCGTGLYGKRDRGPDGSYVTTYCVCLLWIPILPLAAYRVRQVDSGSYQFCSRELLGPIARAWQALVLAGAAIAAGAWGVASYLESPARLARVALEEARKAEAAGDRRGALERYKGVIERYEHVIDAKPAAEAAVRLTAADIAEPATPASVEPIGRVVDAFYELPERVRDGAAAALLLNRLGAWAEQIGGASAAQAIAALAVLDMASKVAGRGSESAWVTERRSKLHRVVADKTAEARPLLALDHYTRIRDADALDAAKKIIDSFGDSPSLWLEAETQVSRWTKNASAIPERRADRDAVRRKLEVAQKAHAEDTAIIDAADEQAIAEALEARPGNQELAVALAEIKRGKGDAEGALALLTALAAPGRLTADAQIALGSCYSDLGELTKADEVLSALLEERLPAFQEAQRAFHEAALDMKRHLSDGPRAGEAPRELEIQMQGLSGEAEQREAFDRWLSEQMDKAPALARMRAEYLRHSVVVPASLSLGMVKLRRAAEAHGDARRAILDGAERVFLSIRREAAGQPGFHLGLGQVYHRLGRTEDGDKELQGVLDRKQPELSLAVVRAYRELGRNGRARPGAEKVYRSDAELSFRHEAALLMAHLVSSLEDRETWLKRSDVNAPAVRDLLDGVAAHRLLRSGKLEEADRVLAKMAAFHERSAKHHGPSANNAAVAYLGRYEATGDVAHVRSAIGYLEGATRLEADSALIVGNLADALEHLGAITILEPRVRTRTLLYDREHASSLIEAMLNGPLRGELLASVERDPSYRKALDVRRQQQVLAPQQPSAYEMQIRWLGWTSDEKGLAELLKRLEAMPALDPEESAAERAEWQSGERYEEFRSYAADSLARARGRLQRAEKARHQPTVAAAWLDLGQALATQADLDPTPAMIDEMVGAYRSAIQAWPEGLSDRELAGALMRAAAYKALSDSPALKQAWDAERRVYGVTMLLHRASTGPAAAEVLAALRKQPELREAAQLRKAKPMDRPDIMDWVLARIAGDSELEQAAAKLFERADVELRLKIEARLYPGQPREQADLDLFASKGRGPL